MNLSTNTHQSVRTVVLSTAVLALALVASGGLSVSALWVVPLLAVAAYFTKLVISQTFPGHEIATELAIPTSMRAAPTDIFI